MSCKPECVACSRYAWDFFNTPNQHGTPECVLELGEGRNYRSAVRQLPVIRCVCKVGESAP